MKTETMDTIEPDLTLACEGELSDEDISELFRELDRMEEEKSLSADEDYLEWQAEREAEALYHQMEYYCEA